MNAYQPDLDNFSGHAGNLHAIADAQSVFADQEEVSDDGDNYVLQGDCHTCSKQTGEGHSRSELGCERENDDYCNRDPEHNPAQQEKLVSATSVVNVAERGTAPNLSQDNHQADQHGQHR